MSGIAVNVGSVQRAQRAFSMSRVLGSPVFDGAAAAYSLRTPQSSSYTGPLIRVRRSSDNAEANIGAVLIADANGNRWLDTTALLAFCGAGNGFVTTWYDQSGNARNATQGTAATQPRIVNSGVVETFNGRPSVFFNSSLLLSPSIPALGGANTPLTFTGVIRTGATLSPYRQWWATGAVSIPFYGLDVAASNSARLYVGTSHFPNETGPSISANTPYVISALYNGSAGTPVLNGVPGSSATFNCNMVTGAINIGGARGMASAFSGHIPELCAFAGARAPTPRLLLERSQGAAFGITVA